jgi:uncharacterized membrane protein YcgQ (UPF0703/DUF1980 family)
VKKLFSRKRFTCLATLALLLALLVGCGGQAREQEGQSTGAASGEQLAIAAEKEAAAVRNSGGLVEIKEKRFIAQCNDILLNPARYTGRKIRIEGMFSAYDDGTGTVRYWVTRNSPGCCGADGVVGFEFRAQQAPDCLENDWIVVEGGIAEEESEYYSSNIFIRDATVTVKTERGAEFVAS